MLLRLIKISDYAMKTPICFAILKLHQQEPLTAAPLVVETILSILNRGNGPSYQEEDQKVPFDFIQNVQSKYKAWELVSCKKN